MSTRQPSLFRPSRFRQRPAPSAILLIPVLVLTLVAASALATTPQVTSVGLATLPAGIANVPVGPVTSGVPAPVIALTPGQTPAPVTTPKTPVRTPPPVKSPVQHPKPVPPKHVKLPPVSCGGSLQAKINAAKAGSTVRLTGCTYSGSATISKALTISGGTLRVPSGSAGLRIEASHVTISGLRLIGPNKSSFSAAEYGIYAVGTPSSPIRGLTVRSSDIGSFGDDGIYAKYVADLSISGNTIHDMVYAGVLVISGQGGSIGHNLIERIGVHGASANGNNAYGVLLTDQGGAATRSFIVASNTIEDVPTWHALDTHGGQQITFTGNTVRRSSRAIFITGSPSGRATKVTVSGNHLLVPVKFNLEAVTTYDTVQVTITGNTITGWGGSTIEDYGGMSTQLVVRNNRVQ